MNRPYAMGQQVALSQMKIASASAMSENPLRWSSLTADHADQITDWLKNRGQAGLDALKNAPWKKIGYGALGAGALAGAWRYGNDLFNEPFTENEVIPQEQY